MVAAEIEHVVSYRVFLDESMQLVRRRNGGMLTNGAQRKESDRTRVRNIDNFPLNTGINRYVPHANNFIRGKPDVRQVFLGNFRKCSLNTGSVSQMKFHK